ncbi:MAG: 7-cyano-7-deazaguanine synthase, partial [Novosphingobium sp.]
MTTPIKDAMDPIAVVLLSGGLDSMVCAGLAKEQGFRI